MIIKIESTKPYYLAGNDSMANAWDAIKVLSGTVLLANAVDHEIWLKQTAKSIGVVTSEAKGQGGSFSKNAESKGEEIGVGQRLEIAPGITLVGE